MVFDWDADTGRLSPAQHWHARPGAGPRHFRFDPDGRFVYLLNELDASLDVLSWNPAQGRLSHLQNRLASSNHFHFGLAHCRHRHRLWQHMNQY
jgi:6-phosphogluconolactonase (cycloisomerase 2 family)